MPGFGSTPVRTRAGERRVKVTLQSATVETDTIGGQSEDVVFEQFGRDQAKVQEIPFVVDGSEHGMLYKLTIKYRRDIVREFLTDKKRVRLVTTARIYALLELENPEQRNVELIMHCAEA